MLSRYHTVNCPPTKRIRVRRKNNIKRIAWNKGLSKKTDARIAKYSELISRTQKARVANGTFIPSIMSVEAKKRLSEEQSLHNRGGKSKWYNVDGVKVQGTWERNLALKFKEIGIKWTKPHTNNEVWKYTQDNVEKSYAPDFYLPDYDIWLEVKGYWWGKDKEKMDIVMKTYPNRKIVIVEKTEYENILKNDLSCLN